MGKRIIMIKKTREDTSTFVTMVAKKQEWKLTRDNELIDFLLDGLTKNFNRYGYFSCPCRLAGNDKYLDKDIICPCLYSKPDIKAYGHCYCGLYQSQEFFSTGKAASSIPERRNAT
jgi:ferredoxin-thioredoxin reductase catalytic chain